MRNITDKQSWISSVYPPTEYLTFGPWIYMVPQYKPEDVLMLGFAGGTVAGLLRIFYGAIPITAVDINKQEDYTERYNVNFIQTDAEKYIKTCGEYDCIIVDMFEDGALTPCNFIFQKEFVEDIIKKGRYIIVHAHQSSDMSSWNNVKLVRTLSLNTSIFYYFRTREIHTLPIQ